MGIYVNIPWSFFPNVTTVELTSCSDIFFVAANTDSDGEIVTTLNRRYPL